MGIKIAAIASDGFNYEAKGLKYDPYLQSFIMGSGGSISDFVLKNGTTDTLVIRGLGGGGQKAIKYCLRNKIDFYAIDSGYIQPGTKKDYHRITKNALQNLGPIKDRGLDRLKKLNWQYKNRNGQTGNKILICPPSDKVMKFYEKDLDNWLAETVDETQPVEESDEDSETAASEEDDSGVEDAPDDESSEEQSGEEEEPEEQEQ